MAEYYGEEKRMKIPVVEPGKGPCVREIEHGLKAMQQFLNTSGGLLILPG